MFERVSSSNINMISACFSWPIRLGQFSQSCAALHPVSVSRGGNRTDYDLVPRWDPDKAITSDRRVLLAAHVKRSPGQFEIEEEDVAQLVQHRTDTPRKQVRCPGAASNFSSKVNLQCRLSYGVRTPPPTHQTSPTPTPCAIVCTDICAHIL